MVNLINYINANYNKENTMKKLIILVSAVIVLAACEPVNDAEDCNLQSFFTADYWRICFTGLH